MSTTPPIGQQVKLSVVGGGIFGYPEDDNILTSAADNQSISQSVFTIMEKASSRAFSWLKAPTSAFTFMTPISCVLTMGSMPGVQIIWSNS